MKLRILAVTGLLLGATASAASANTTAVYTGASSLLTLTNDGTAETFVVNLDASADPEYVITATSGTIDDPAVAGCARSNGNRTLSCTDAAGIDQLDLLGAAGDDSVTINGEDSYVYGNTRLDVAGGADDDTFTAGTGARLDGNAIDGGPGNDTFVGSDERSDTFYAEAGNDTYRGGTAPVPPGIDPNGFQRFQAPDSFYPVGDAALTLSLDGVANDLDGQGGTDNLIDLERLSGADGNDTLTAGSGAVDLEGGSGDDTLTGSPQDDILDGRDGNDVLRGGAGDDSLYDGDYDYSYVFADDPPPPVGNDTIDAGEGNDFVFWGAGRDDVVGGPGTDTAAAQRFAVQTFPTAPVPDDFQPREQALTVSLNDVADDGPTGGTENDNIHSDVENLEIGNAGRGLQVARSARFIEVPVPAGHTITGSPAANSITTGAGPDTIDPGAGADVVNAFGGDDRISAVDVTTDVIGCGRGTDTVGADLPGTNAARADVLADCETVSGTPLGLEGGALPARPAVTVGGPKTVKVKKFLRSYTLTTPVTTDQAVNVEGELSIAGARIAKVGALTIGSGRLASSAGTSKLKTKVAVRYRKALKRKLRTKRQRRRGIRLTLAVTARNPSGQATTKRRTVRIKG